MYHSRSNTAILDTLSAVAGYYILPGALVVIATSVVLKEFAISTQRGSQPIAGRILLEYQ